MSVCISPNSKSHFFLPALILIRWSMSVLGRFYLIFRSRLYSLSYRTDQYRFFHLKCLFPMEALEIFSCWCNQKLVQHYNHYNASWHIVLKLNVLAYYSTCQILLFWLPCATLNYSLAWCFWFFCCKFSIVTIVNC